MNRSEFFQVFEALRPACLQASINLLQLPESRKNLFAVPVSQDFRRTQRIRIQTQRPVAIPIPAGEP